MTRCPGAGSTWLRAGPFNLRHPRRLISRDRTSHCNKHDLSSIVMVAPDLNATEGRIPMDATTRPHTRKIFAMTDAMDVAMVVSLFAKDGRAVFGNGQPMV